MENNMEDDMKTGSSSGCQMDRIRIRLNNSPTSANMETRAACVEHQTCRPTPGTPDPKTSTV